MLSSWSPPPNSLDSIMVWQGLILNSRFGRLANLREDIVTWFDSHFSPMSFDPYLLSAAGLATSMRPFRMPDIWHSALPSPLSRPSCLNLPSGLRCLGEREVS